MRFLKGFFEARDLAPLGEDEDFTVAPDDLDHELAPSAQLELRWRFRDAHLFRD